MQLSGNDFYMSAVVILKHFWKFTTSGPVLAKIANKMADLKKETVRWSYFNETSREWFLHECGGNLEIMFKTWPYLGLFQVKMTKKWLNFERA